VEALIVTALVAGAAAMSVPVWSNAVDAAEANAAARHIAGLIARARFEAARRCRVVALRFAETAGETTFSLVVDGDADGVGAADWPRASMSDSSARPAVRSLRRGQIRGRAMPAIDGASILTALDAPIRLGTAQQVSLGPLGTATSSLYIASRRGVRAVRIAITASGAALLPGDGGGSRSEAGRAPRGGASSGGRLQARVHGHLRPEHQSSS
jgi:type II secretory pathway pseudopilin PulG